MGNVIHLSQYVPTYLEVPNNNNLAQVLRLWWTLGHVYRIILPDTSVPTVTTLECIICTTQARKVEVSNQEIR